MRPEDDQPMTLYPDRRPATVLAVLAVVAMIGGAWIAWRGATATGAAVASAGFLAMIGSLVWLIPSRCYLHLGDRGFTYCSRFNPARIDWIDVERFGLATIEGERRVAWDYAPHYPADMISRERTKKQVGFEAVLPRCCGLSPDALADLLARRKQRSGG